MSQEELQEATGINRQLTGRVEQGAFIPSIAQLQKLTGVLGLEIKDLMEPDTSENVFVAMRGEAKTDTEKEGLDQLFSMMLLKNIQGFKE